MRVITQAQVHVRHLQAAVQDQANVRIEADGDVQVLDVLDRALEEFRGAGHVRDQVADGGEIQAGEQAAGIRQLQVQVEDAGVDLEQVENADARAQADVQGHRVVIEGMGLAAAAHGHGEATALHGTEVDETGRHGIVAHLHEADVEAQLHVIGFQGDERIGAHQARGFRRGLDTEEVDRQRLRAGAKHRTHHGQGQVEIIDGEADGILVGRILAVDDAVMVDVGTIGTVDAGKAVDILSDDDQRLAGRNDAGGGGNDELHLRQGALLEGHRAAQRKDAGDVGGKHAHRRLDDGVVVVQIDRRAAGFNGIAVPGIAVTIHGEIGDQAILVALVDAHPHVFEGKLEEVLEADEADVGGSGLQRHEAGLGIDRGGQRIADDVLGGGAEHAHAEVEITNPEADGIGGQIIGVDPAVAVDIGRGATDADEGVDVIGAEFDAVELGPVDLQVERPAHGQFHRAAHAEGKVTGKVDELGHHQQGVMQLGLDKGALGIVDQHRVGAGLHQQAAARGKALLEIHHRPQAGAAHPTRAPVGADLDVLAKDFKDALAAGHQEFRRVGGNRRHRRQLQVLVGGLHDGQAHIHVTDHQTEDVVLLAHRRGGIEVRVAITDKDVHILHAEGDRLHFHIRDLGPVFGHIRPGRGELGVGGGPLRIAEADAGIDGDAMALALLEAEGARDVNELFHGEYRMRDRNTESATGEGQRHRVAAGGHFQAIGAVGGDEVDIGTHGRIRPCLALVGFQLDALRFQRQVRHTDEGELVGGGGQRPEVAHFLGGISEHGQAQVEIFHDQADRVRVSLTDFVDFAIAIIVQLVVLGEIRPGADKQVHIRKTQDVAVHRIAVDAGVIQRADIAGTDQAGQCGTGLGCGGDAEAGADIHRHAGPFFKTEPAFDEEEVVDLEQRMTHFDAEHGTIEIDAHGFATGADLIALAIRHRAEAGTEVDIGPEFGAAPDAPLVHLHGEVGNIQLHEAPVDVHQGPRQGRLEGVHVGDDPLRVHRLGGTQDGEANVYVQQLEERIVHVADGDVDVGGADVDGVDWQVGEAAVVGAEIARRLEGLEIGRKAGSRASQQGGQSGDHIHLHARGFFEGEIALDAEEVADVEQGVGQAHADHASRISEVHGRAGDSGHSETVSAEAGDEVDVRVAQLAAAPGTGQVGIHREMADLELEEAPVEGKWAVPVHLDGEQLGNDRIRVGSQGGIQHHQAEIDVVQGDAEGVGVGRFVGVKQAVAVAVDEIGAESDKDVDVAGGQHEGIHRQVIDAAVVRGQALHLAQPGAQGAIHIRRIGGRQAGHDIHFTTARLLEIEAATDVDVIGDRQGGATDGDREQGTAIAGHVEIDAGAVGSGGHRHRRAEIHHGHRGRPVRAGLVDLDGNVLGHQGDGIDADEGHRPGFRLQRGPFLGRRGLAAHQRQGELHAFQLEAEFIAGAGVDTGEGLDAGSADGQQVDVDFRAVGQRHMIAALLDGEAA